MKSSITRFLVVLDEPSRVFSPGDHVHGKVVLDVKQEIKLWKLNLECRGEVYVSWPENSGTYTRYRFGREELFDLKACVYGETEDNIKSKPPSSSVLKPSAYSFSFRFTIPCIDLPPSYEAKHGCIRYWMQASIERKKGKCELKTTEQLFDIGGYEEYDDEELTNMKDYEQQKYPNSKEAKRSIKGSCYRPENSTLSARTNKLLYHPGEVINTHVTTDNEAHRGARTIEVSLVRLTFYDDGKNNKTNSQQDVVSVEKEVVKDADEQDLELVLPSKSLYPTMVRGCMRIKVTYYVRVRLKINGKIQKEPVLMIPVAVVPSPVLPASTQPTPPSHSDLQKDNVRNNSVSNLVPGTLFYVTGSPYGNQRDISTGPLYANKGQYRSKRAPRIVPLDEDASRAFYFNDRPPVSYV